MSTSNLASDAVAEDAQIDALWPDPAQGLSDIDLLARLKSPFAPWVSANFVSSLDGAVSTEGKTAGLGSPADRRMFDLLRRPASAIMVGAGTVRTEGYGPMVLDEASVAWRTAAGLPAHPVFVLVSGKLDLDPASRIFTEAPVRPIVITTAAAPVAKWDALEDVADIINAGDDTVDAVVAITALRARGLPRIHSEGGPSLFGSLLAADVVDELSLTVSPKLVGGDAGRIVSGDLPDIRSFALASVLRSADVLLLRYQRGDRG